MDEIYNEYSKFVYKYLLALTNNKDLSEELMQETFYSAIKNIKTLNLLPALLVPILFFLIKRFI